MTWKQPIYDRRGEEVVEITKKLNEFNVDGTEIISPSKSCLNHSDLDRIEENTKIIIDRFFVNRAAELGKMESITANRYSVNEVIDNQRTKRITNLIGQMLDIIPVPPKDQAKPENLIFYPHVNRVEEILDYYHNASFIYKSELIRSKDGLGELEVIFERDSTREPKRLFEIHIENGVAQTSWRNYTKKAYEEWKDGVVLGEAKACSICFNGEWESEEGKWLLITEDTPWCFWVDNQGVLYSQKWDDTSTKFVVSEDVSKVRSVRAWKSVNFRSLDLGLIVGYLKNDGKVYYRNYCEQDNGDTVWEAEREFETNGAVVSFNLFETIDYRVGLITINSDGMVDMYFSRRNWAGMGIRAEFLNVQMSEKIEIIELKKWEAYNKEYVDVNVDEQMIYGYILTDNKLLHVYNEDDGSGDWGKVVVFGTDNDLHNIKSTDFKITDNRGVSASPFEVEYIGRGDGEHRFPFLYRAKFQNINNFKGECTAEILGITTQNVLGQAYPHMTLTFTPEHLQPLDIPAPKVVSVVDTDDRHIVITFDREIFGGATESVSAMSITSKAYKTTNTDVIVVDTHNITSLELSEDRLRITLTIDVPTRIKRAIDLTVAYTNGSMVGEAEPVANFSHTFKPTITNFTSDIGAYEYVDINVDERIDVIKIDYKDVAKNYREHIDINISERIEITRIDNVNP